MPSAIATIDHEQIRRWVEERGGCPSHVKSTADGDDPGILRIDFPGYSGKQSLEQLDWDTWFQAFEDNELALLVQEGKDSRFNKLVSRDSVDVAPSQSARANTRKSEKGRSRFDAIKLLEQQHRNVEAAFAQYENATSARDKSRLFDKIGDMLAAHSAIEERFFYPQSFNDKTEDELREAVEEHLQVKRVIRDLLEMKPQDPQFDAKMTTLKELVEHHVEEEEDDLFKLVRKEGLVNLAELGATMEREFKKLMQNAPRKQVPEETAHAAPLP